MEQEHIKAIKTNKDNQSVPMKSGEFVMYKPDDSIQIGVMVSSDTVWLTRGQLALLFDRDIKTIGKHIANAMREELYGTPTVAKFATVQHEGNRSVCRTIEYYNLDMVLSIGYRVKSNRGIAFRIWANNVLKQYLLRGYSVNTRIDQLEERLTKTEETVDFFIKSALPPVQGIFFDGQIFDAYTFATGLIKSAREALFLIDNYVDETVLTMLNKRSEGVMATICTKNINKEFQLDLDKNNAQYAPINIIPFNKAHDRFLIVDDRIYHIGASLKDLGKKWFAFSLLKDIDRQELLSRLG